MLGVLLLEDLIPTRPDWANNGQGLFLVFWACCSPLDGVEGGTVVLYD